MLQLCRYTLFLTALLFSQSNFAQVSTVFPEHPRWRDTLQISYNLQDVGAQLSGKEPVYAKVTTFGQQGGYQWYTLKLAGDTILRQSFMLPDSIASFTIRFYTLNKDDDKALKKLYVYEKDRQTTVAGAYFEDFFTDKPQPVFEKEIGMHPANYLAYGKYFNVISLVKPIEESHNMIKALLPGLERVYQTAGTPPAGLLAALCIGYAKAGNLSVAKPFLFQLFKTFPQAEETAFAFSLYNYEYYKATTKMVEEDVKQQLAVIYRQWPAAALAGDVNVNWYLHDDRSLSVTDFEKALLPRYRAGSIPYYGLSMLPGIYVERETHLDSAEAILLRCIRMFQDGSINHQYRLSKSHDKMETPLMLQKLAKVYLLQQQYEKAIIHATAGIAIIAGSNEEGNFLPDLLEVRAAAYRKAGNLNMAMEDYKQLYKSGKENALDSIKAIFSLCTVKEKTFEGFVTALQQKPKTTTQVQRAPDFTGNDLQGNTVRLSALKGKVVVLNFWGTGCGPCIGEMPTLNKLVQKYKNNDSVVFLAITGDKSETLRQFFKKRSFLYTVLNNAGNVSEAYGINSLPIHIVIGKEGQIINRSAGAREDIFDYLDGVIRREL
ncbi:MAG: TlpA disulfide reductase family protein [Chitinophagaceae bacterium]